MGFWKNQLDKNAVLNLLKHCGATTTEANEIQKLLTIPILKQLNPIIEYVGKEARIVLFAYVATAFMQEALRLNFDASKGTVNEDIARRAHRDAVCYNSDIRMLLIEGCNNGAISEVIRDGVDNFIEHIINSTQVKEEAQPPKKSVKEGENQASMENKEATKILESLSSEGREMAEILMLHAEVAAEKSYYGLPFSDYRDWALRNNTEAIGVTQVVEIILASCEADKHSAKTVDAYKAYVCRIAANYVKVHEGQLLSDINNNLKRVTTKNTQTQTPKRPEKEMPEQSPTVQKKGPEKPSGVAFKLALLLVISIIFALAIVKTDKPSTKKTAKNTYIEQTVSQPSTATPATAPPAKKAPTETLVVEKKKEEVFDDFCRRLSLRALIQYERREKGETYEYLKEHYQAIGREQGWEGYRYRMELHSLDYAFTLDLGGDHAELLSAAYRGCLYPTDNAGWIELRELYYKHNPSIDINISGSAYVNNNEVGQILVINGEAINKHTASRSSITIKGVLLDEQGKALLQQTVFCGNQLANSALEALPFKDIEEAMNNEFGADLSNMNVATGASIPFTIVFRNLPAGIANINVEVVDSKSGAGKSQ